MIKIKIAILGSSGNVKSVLVDEALSRGYKVLALVKDKNKSLDFKIYTRL